MNTQNISQATGRPVKFKQSSDLKYMVFALYDPSDLKSIKFVGVTALARGRNRDRSQALQAYINRMINSARCKTAGAYTTRFGTWLRELKTAPAYAIIKDGMPRNEAAQLRTRIGYEHFTTCLNNNIPRQMPKEVPYVAD